MNKWTWLCSRPAIALGPALTIPGLFLMAISIASAAEISQHKVVRDVDVVLTVLHAKELPGSESQGDHHLVISLFQKGTSNSIEGAEVRATVAEAGYAGTEKALQPAMVDGKPAYGGVFMMPERSEYRISIKVRQQGESRAIEVPFVYRHHHKIS